MAAAKKFVSAFTTTADETAFDAMLTGEGVEMFTSAATPLGDGVHMFTSAATPSGHLIASGEGIEMFTSAADPVRGAADEGAQTGLFTSAATPNSRGDVVSLLGSE
ncbi:MAG: hypothetical protein AAF601_09180 [Pseudomonadota bacterium]